MHTVLKDLSYQGIIADKAASLLQVDYLPNGYIAALIVDPKPNEEGSHIKLAGFTITAAGDVIGLGTGNQWEGLDFEQMPQIKTLSNQRNTHRYDAINYINAARGMLELIDGMDPENYTVPAARLKYYNGDASLHPSLILAGLKDCVAEIVENSDFIVNPHKSITLNIKNTSLTNRPSGV